MCFEENYFLFNETDATLFSEIFFKSFNVLTSNPNFRFSEIRNKQNPVISNSKNT